MLKIQEFLRSKLNPDIAINHLEKIGINCKLHINGKLLLCNYNQIEADKNNPMACEARGLVLEYGTWNLISKSFSRFFNLREMEHLHKYFNWHDFQTQEKLDGSILSFFRYNGKVYVNTRNTFGDGKVNNTSFTWRELAEQCINLDSMFRLPLELNVDSISCELLSKYNKIVTEYPNTELRLLSAWRGCNEVSSEFADSLAKYLGLSRPKVYKLNSQYEVEQFILDLAEKEPTHEGVVLRDNNNMRIKVKSLSYLSLSRIHNNGTIASYKNLLPLILLGESWEIIAYFPELKNKIIEIEQEINIHFGILMNVWNEAKHIKNQKDFAVYVLQKTAFSGILFLARKKGICPSKIWRESSDIIYKTLFKSKDNLCV